jgi:hypothetical protein
LVRPRGFIGHSLRRSAASVASERRVHRISTK